MSQQITVILNDNGTVTVTGHIQNTIMAYGLLEAAKDILRANTKTAESPTVVTPPEGLVVPPFRQ